MRFSFSQPWEHTYILKVDVQRGISIQGLISGANEGNFCQIDTRLEADVAKAVQEDGLNGGQRNLGP